MECVIISCNKLSYRVLGGWPGQHCAPPVYQTIARTLPPRRHCSTVCVDESKSPTPDLERVCSQLAIGSNETELRKRLHSAMQFMHHHLHIHYPDEMPWLSRLHGVDWCRLLPHRFKSIRLREWLVRTARENRRRRSLAARVRGQCEEVRRARAAAVRRGVQYGRSDTCMFDPYCERPLWHAAQLRLMAMLMYGQTVLVDLGREQMSPPISIYNCGRAVRHIVRAVRYNSSQLKPLNLQLCGVGEGSRVEHLLRQFVPIHPPSRSAVDVGDNDDFDIDWMDDVDCDTINLPLSVTSQDCLDLYEPKRLVYLVPYTNTALSHLNPDDVYVLGGFTDNVPDNVISAGVRTASLPLIDHLRTPAGFTASRPLYEVIRILSSVAAGNSWKTALQCVKGAKVLEDMSFCRADSEKTVRRSSDIKWLRSVRYYREVYGTNDTSLRASRYRRNNRSV